MAWAEGRCRGERVLVRAVQGWGRGGCRHGDAQLALAGWASQVLRGWVGRRPL